jgi:hypothetical protein
VTFARSFFQQKINRELPAGSYDNETDEESLEDVSTLAYRRVEVRFFVPRIAGRSDPEMWIIKPQDLDIVLAIDREPAARRDRARSPEPAAKAAPQAAGLAREAADYQFAQRKAAFEKSRDDVLSSRGMRSNGPLYGACLGILALLFATWVANQI